MIITKYFNRQLVHTMLIVMFTLLLIVISNMFIRYLSIVSNGNVEAAAIFKFIAIMLPKYIAYILPLSFFFAILITYGKIFSNNELTVAFASGMTWFKIVRMVMKPALMVFIVEIILTLIVLPQVDQSYFLVAKTTAKSSLLSFIEPGKISSFNDDKEVVYIKNTDSKGVMHNIFIYREKNHSSKTSTVITAPEAYATVKNGDQYLTLINGHHYTINNEDKTIDTGKFKTITQFISGKININKNISISSKSTYKLFEDGGSANQSELQWRLAFPFFLLVGTLIAIAICKMLPRQNRYGRIIPALLICIAYFNFISLSRSWISSGVVPPWIGIWWVHILFAVAALVIIKKHNGPIFMPNRKNK